MQLLLLRLLILLLLFPPPSLTRAHPSRLPQTSRQLSEGIFSQRTFIITLIDGQTSRRFDQHFLLNSPIPSDVSETQVLTLYNQTFTIKEGPNIISSQQFTYIPPESGNTTVFIVSCEFSFHFLPGLVHAVLSYTEPNSTIPHQVEFQFHVVGIVLYSLQPSADPVIHSGLASSPIRLPEPNDRPQIRTINATIYSGPSNIQFQSNSILQREKIQLSVTVNRRETDPANPVDASDLLPWNLDQCSIFLKTSQLDHRCSMAFSPTFDQFTIRVPGNNGLREEVRIDFVWVGLANFSKAVNEFEGNVEGNVAGAGETPALTNDRLSFAIVNDAGSARVNDVGAGFEGWKVAVVVLVLVLVLIAAVVLICCYCGCGKWENESDTSKPVLTGWAARMRWWSSKLRLGRDETRSEQLRKCHVHEPASMGNLTVLMLGTSQRSLRLEGEGDEISREGDGGSGAERLVLAGMVRRGIDLEPSTEGGSFRFPLSDEELSFARGSLTEGDFEDSPREGGGHFVDKREQISDYDDESRMTGAETTIDRSGVGAAINRVRQLDMLKGPASKGLPAGAGKSGPSEPQRGEGSGAQRPACPLSASTVS
eukprot:GFKZ01014531.1.p1 GENE.GFKZ01014531.1~~GFKZ01014531.1.p1  ORF type:complete len:595 (+),score=68.20 GFKZ01014531.1:314-2098(+)